MNKKTNMGKNKMDSAIVGSFPQSVEETIRKQPYVPPRVEVYAAESSAILAGTTEIGGTHEDGEQDYNVGGSAGSGSGDGTITGAKQMILGREFSFSDLWEE